LKARIQVSLRIDQDIVKEVELIQEAISKKTGMKISKIAVYEQLLKIGIKEKRKKQQ